MEVLVASLGDMKYLLYETFQLAGSGDTLVFGLSLRQLQYYMCLRKHRLVRPDRNATSSEHMLVAVLLLTSLKA